MCTEWWVKNRMALSIAVSILKKSLPLGSWASTSALPLHPPPHWWMIAGCASAYMDSSPHGFQLELSGTCIQHPTGIQIGKKKTIKMHTGKHSSKTNINPWTHKHTLDATCSVCGILFKTHTLVCTCLQPQENCVNQLWSYTSHPPTLTHTYTVYDIHEHECHTQTYRSHTQV